MLELHVAMIFLLGASVMGVVRWMTQSSSSMVAARAALAFVVAAVEAIVVDVGGAVERANVATWWNKYLRGCGRTSGLATSFERMAWNCVRQQRVGLSHLL